MTKKHFELIARILRESDIENKYDKVDLIWLFGAELEKAFPKFNRTKFISAASMPKAGREESK